MIEEQAVVVEVGDGYAWVETQRRSACSACATSEGCGTAVLAKAWGDRRARVRAISNLPLQPGDSVIVGLAEGALLGGSLLVYLLPLVLLLGGAILGQTVFTGAGDQPVMLSGAVGLGLGFLVARTWSRRWQDDARFQPVVLRRLAVAAMATGVLSSP
ncbi:SoxR reducing system RseC family protein [Candidatus Contendibacter odensensis]|uniref:Positive regulator of sigma E, RseC/MucC n=1 Tax=Candidatus Contendobacter odensis Run_B_J11 TaxID=1400861 RepID=A0A7U7GBR9_9GAMM|nr:SoxR reducing system RseC family protein [Candidatus Contendobacter odensis]MBK8753570.1 SoxR reducing system RseC family protein [Candidatus Competibacteraceae bacterium]CDH45247.1 Positive regulator of sigma E, RseC/MucC [Candidatus Contendobacter odensis Run_B_J11]